MNTKLLILLTMLAFAVSCQQGPSENQPPAPQAHAASHERREVLANGVVIEITKVTELRDDRSNYNLFKQNLNVYEAKFIIPENVFTSGLEISRTLSASSLNPSYEVITKGDAEFKDNHYIVTDRLSLRGLDLTKKTITYKVYTDEELNGEASAVLIPDLIIETGSERVTLRQLGISSGRYEFGVVVFENNSTLVTEGASVFFKAQKVFSANGKVESFSEKNAQQNPDIGQVGKNGGRFILHADSAWGFLTVTMRGTKGGEGYPAPLQTGVGAAGGKGANGRRVKIMCDTAGPKVIDQKTELFSAKSSEGMICDWLCIDPQNGADGSTGPAGFSGGIGMQGGSSGAAEVIINKVMGAFDVDVQRFAGLGGLGADGSLGGDGGVGGAPGDAASGCGSNAQPGRNGASGQKGAKGESGADGLTEKSTVIINGKQIL